MPSKEQESSSILSIRLPDELIQRLDRYLDWWETSRRVKASRNAVLREALSQWLEAHEHEAGLVHAPTLRHQFWNAVHRLAQGPHEVRIHRLRQTLPWPRERFDAMLEALRHKDFECDAVALAKLVMKEREKPGKFLLPHGIILLFWWFRICMEDNP